MEEPTEREKLLINCLLKLFNLLNCYSIFVDNIFTSCRWLGEKLEKDDFRKSEDEVLEFLEKDFGIKLNKVSAKDLKPNPEIK